jgi:hypothetical protein
VRPSPPHCTVRTGKSKAAAKPRMRSSQRRYTRPQLIQQQTQRTIARAALRQRYTRSQSSSESARCKPDTAAGGGTTRQRALQVMLASPVTA